MSVSKSSRLMLRDDSGDFRFGASIEEAIIIGMVASKAIQYASNDQPDNPKFLEKWLDTSGPLSFSAVSVWTGSAFVPITLSDPTQLLVTYNANQLNTSPVATERLTGVINLSQLPKGITEPIVRVDAFADLTSEQQAEISEGSRVRTTNDGKLWEYNGSGDRLVAGSYQQLADTTPDFSALVGQIADAQVPDGEITQAKVAGLVAGLAAKADTSSLAYFATGTDAANLSGTVAAARIADNSLTIAKLSDVTAVGSGAIITSDERTKLSGIAAGATAGADWNSNVSGKPTLGTAAGAAIGDFATAAQGTTADSAVQPADRVGRSLVLQSLATSVRHDEIFDPSLYTTGYNANPLTAIDVGVVSWSEHTTDAQGRKIMRFTDPGFNYGPRIKQFKLAEDGALGRVWCRLKMNTAGTGATDVNIRLQGFDGVGGTFKLNRSLEVTSDLQVADGEVYYSTVLPVPDNGSVVYQPAIDFDNSGGNQAEIDVIEFGWLHLSPAHKEFYLDWFHGDNWTEKSRNAANVMPDDATLIVPAGAYTFTDEGIDLLAAWQGTLRFENGVTITQAGSSALPVVKALTDGTLYDLDVDYAGGAALVLSGDVSGVRTPEQGEAFILVSDSLQPNNRHLETTEKYRMGLNHLRIKSVELDTPSAGKTTINLYAPIPADLQVGVDPTNTNNGLEDAWTTARNAKVCIPNVKRRITVEGEPEINATHTNNVATYLFQMCDLDVSVPKLDKAQKAGPGIELRSCTGIVDGERGLIQNCAFGGGNDGYGISTKSSLMTYHKVSTEFCRHGETTASSTRTADDTSIAKITGSCRSAFVRREGLKDIGSEVGGDSHHDDYGGEWVDCLFLDPATNAAWQYRGQHGAIRDSYIQGGVACISEFNFSGSIYVVDDITALGTTDASITTAGDLVYDRATSSWYEYDGTGDTNDLANYAAPAGDIPWINDQRARSSVRLYNTRVKHMPTTATENGPVFAQAADMHLYNCPIETAAAKGYTLQGGRIFFHGSETFTIDDFHGTATLQEVPAGETHALLHGIDVSDSWLEDAGFYVMPGASITADTKALAKGAGAGNKLALIHPVDADVSIKGTIDGDLSGDTSEICTVGGGAVVCEGDGIIRYSLDGKADNSGMAFNFASSPRMKIYAKDGSAGMDGTDPTGALKLVESDLELAVVSAGTGADVNAVWTESNDSQKLCDVAGASLRTMIRGEKTGTTDAQTLRADWAGNFNFQFDLPATAEAFTLQMDAEIRAAQSEGGNGQTIYWHVAYVDSSDGETHRIDGFINEDQAIGTATENWRLDHNTASGDGLNLNMRKFFASAFVFGVAA